MGSNVFLRRAEVRFNLPVLLALIFLAVGLGVGLWLGSELLGCSRMRSWVETPATIIRAKLVEHPDIEGNQPTYEAIAEYKYQYGGRDYTGNRVGVHRGPDNVGSFHRDAYRQLSSHQSSGRPFRCYVNPAKPADSVLFRDMRWGVVVLRAIFAMVFVGFGVFAAARAAGGRRAAMNRRTPKRRGPLASRE